MQPQRREVRVENDEYEREQQRLAQQIKCVVVLRNFWMLCIRQTDLLALSSSLRLSSTYVFSMRGKKMVRITQPFHRSGVTADQYQANQPAQTCRMSFGGLFYSCSKSSYASRDLERQLSSTRFLLGTGDKYTLSPEESRTVIGENYVKQSVLRCHIFSLTPIATINSQLFVDGQCIL